ncbi:MAG: Eco47II family restriction endonuclease [Colwellia sp.]|nr:Eco47II family restriction endonuclease [Colwellia sp.]
MTKDYELSFISNGALLAHVKGTIDTSNINEMANLHLGIAPYINQDFYIENKNVNIINRTRKLFITIVPKCSDLTSTNARSIFMTMQNKILLDRETDCYLVEKMAPCEQETLWEIKVNDECFSHPNIKRISLNKYYFLLTGISNAYNQLNKILPTIIHNAITTCE